MTAAFTVLSILGTAQSAPFHERNDSSAPHAAREMIAGCATPPVTACADTVANVESAATVGDVTVSADKEVTDEPAAPTARSSTPVASPTYRGSVAFFGFVASRVSSTLSSDHADHVPFASVLTSSVTVPVDDAQVAPTSWKVATWRGATAERTDVPLGTSCGTDIADTRLSAGMVVTLGVTAGRTAGTGAAGRSGTEATAGGAGKVNRSAKPRSRPAGRRARAVM